MVPYPPAGKQRHLNTQYMEPKDKSNSSFEDSPSTTMNPPVSSSSNSNNHVASRTSSSTNISGRHPCQISSNVKSAWYGSNATDYSVNSSITSDMTLDYINKLLMQEDSDERVQLHHGENALRAMEEPFYKLLGQNNPVYPHPQPLCNCDHLKNIADNISKSCSICSVAIDSSTSHSNRNVEVFEAPWSLSDIVKEKKQFTQGTLSMELGLNVDGLSIAEKRSRDNQSLQVNVEDESKHALSEVNSGNYSSTEEFQFLERRSSKQFAVSLKGHQVSSSSNSNGHVALSTSSSTNIYGPHPCEVRSNVKSDWYGTNATDYSANSWIASDITLDYINKLLMQEDSDDRVKSHHGENALRTMEEPFYKLLGQNNPVYPHRLPFCNCDHLKNIDDNIRKSNDICSVAIDSSASHSNHNLQVFEPPWSLSEIVNEKKQFTEGTLSMELGLNVGGLSIAEKRSRDNQSLQVNVADKSKHALSEVHSGNYSHTEDFPLLEGRSSKQLAISFNGITRDEKLDRVLLSSEHKLTNEDVVLREMMTNKSNRNSQNDQGRTSARWKMQFMKHHKEEVVDLTILLTRCAEAVSVNNYTLTSDILNIIRQHSSVSGDDTQRLASCLADSLEVRLAGTGDHVYRKLMTETRNGMNTLKVYQLVLAICPFMRAPYYFSNKTILDVSKGKPKVHIIDFGICFGFQWPSLFEQLARREDGPPKVRITGIELPMPGFRPNQMNKNAGQLLADYATMFNVPLEYKGISSKWETIHIEDLNIEEDDVLVANCLFRMKDLDDETVSFNCARNRVLNIIRMMKPKVFVHGVVNGSYSTPFFLTRFKAVMHHYSALFDILDRTVPRDNEARMILERGICQCAILNAVACEGSERIERPESYKYWKLRNLKAGLEQLPLNPDIVKVIRDTVGQYHEDYVVDVDDQWLLLGWKGRILRAISTWKPSESYDSN